MEMKEPDDGLVPLDQLELTLVNGAGLGTAVIIVTDIASPGYPPPPSGK